MKRSEFWTILDGAVADESKRLIKRMNDMTDKNGKISTEEMCAFILAELPQTSAIVTGKIIEKCGLLEFESEDSQ